MTRTVDIVEGSGRADAGGGAAGPVWGALFVLLAGTLLSPLDFFIVNTTLPAIQTDLGADAASVQLVVSGYAAAYAVLLMTGGRLGDLYGRRRVFVFGMAGFALASLGCGLSATGATLIVFRIVQGGCAAVLMPQSLATIRAVFPAELRPRALGFYAATFGVAAILGQLLGGVLVALDLFGLGWRAIFLVNLPVVAVIVPLALLFVRESRAPDAKRLDVVGVLLASATLCAFIVPLVEGRERGWPLWTLVLLAATVPLAFAFRQFEAAAAARDDDPLFPPSVLEAPGLRRALAATLLFYCYGAYFLLFALYQQNGLGRTPLQAGLAILPFGVGFAVASLFSARILARVGRRAPALSMIVVAAAMFGSAVVVLTGHGWATAVIGGLAGIGQGFGLPALIRSVIDRFGRRWAGLGAGLVNTVLQLSGALSFATIGGLYFAILGEPPRGDRIPVAFAAALAAMGIGLLGAAWLIAGAVDHVASDELASDENAA